MDQLELAIGPTTQLASDNGTVTAKTQVRDFIEVIGNTSRSNTLITTGLMVRIEIK